MSHPALPVFVENETEFSMADVHEHVRTLPNGVVRRKESLATTVVTCMIIVVVMLLALFATRVTTSDIAAWLWRVVQDLPLQTVSLHALVFWLVQKDWASMATAPILLLRFLRSAPQDDVTLAASLDAVGTDLVKCALLFYHQHAFALAAGGWLLWQCKQYLNAALRSMPQEVYMLTYAFLELKLTTGAPKTYDETLQSLNAINHTPAAFRAVVHEYNFVFPRPHNHVPLFFTSDERDAYMQLSAAYAKRTGVGDKVAALMTMDTIARTHADPFLKNLARVLAYNTRADSTTPILDIAVNAYATTIALPGTLSPRSRQVITEMMAARKFGDAGVIRDKRAALHAHLMSKLHSSQTRWRKLMRWVRPPAALGGRHVPPPLLPVAPLAWTPDACFAAINAVLRAENDPAIQALYRAVIADAVRYLATGKRRLRPYVKTLLHVFKRAYHGNTASRDLMHVL